MVVQRIAWVVVALQVSSTSLIGQSHLFERNGSHVFGVLTEKRFGRRVASVGDLDGDGVGDLLVGIPSYILFGDQIGGARVSSGATGVTLLVVQGKPGLNQVLGYSLAGLGDVDGDGVSDFALGDPAANVNGLLSGQVQVISGALGKLLYTFDGQQGDELGRSLAAAADIDYDGVADLYAGAPRKGSSGAGWVRAYSLGTGKPLHTYTGPKHAVMFGWALDSIGDLNGDQRRDLLVGAPTKDGVTRGRVYAYSGDKDVQLFSLQGTLRFGGSVAGLSSVDGDEVADLLVGDTDALTSTGKQVGSATIFSGADQSIVRTFLGSQETRFGESVDGIGDVDGDQVEDVVIGDPWHWTPQGNQYGSVFVRSSATGVSLYSVSGNTELGGFGDSVAGLGDLDGDGFDEFAVGAPVEESSSGRTDGSVHVYGTSSLGLEFNPDWIRLGDTFRIDARGGLPFTPFLMVMTKVGRVPTFLNVLVGQYDANGQWSAKMPSPLALDLDITFALYTVGKKGQGTRQSSTEEVHFLQQ